MKTTRTSPERTEGEPKDASGISVSIRWWHGGWALAIVIAALVLARIFGFL